MDKPEFLLRLVEDKFFNNPKELIEYRLPVLQFYIDNYDYALFNGFVVKWKKGVKIIRTDDDFKLINQSFNSLKLRIDEL